MEGSETPFTTQIISNYNPLDLFLSNTASVGICGKQDTTGLNSSNTFSTYCLILFINMKLMAILLPVLITTWLIGCSSDDEPGSFTLTITNGSGSGLYPVGRSVTIAAQTAPEGKEFDTWTGDSDLVASRTNPITTLTMPSRDAVVTATYRDIDYGEPVKIMVDQTTKYQTIDGFGFFGAHDVWWGSASDMWNDAWGEKAISDLGITIWRNEYYPPSTPEDKQDSDWAKQKPVVQGLKAKADKYNVNLKFVFTVWSPPAALNGNRNSHGPVIRMPRVAKVR